MHRAHLCMQSSFGWQFCLCADLYYQYHNANDLYLQNYFIRIFPTLQNIESILLEPEECLNILAKQFGAKIQKKITPDIYVYEYNIYMLLFI